ncbi:hypothetical protein [Lutimonas vermicola]|uniref:Secreted protein n=1 Tax=Lutimonas vermicola TaxID=414288 RepID=A0ABU9KXX1_9FLAO
MKKTGLLFVLLALLFTSVQCTEDEDVEAKVYQEEFNTGDQELDSKRD